MNHTPFIVASYAIGAVVMAWCALAPLVKKKAAIRNIRRLIQIEDRAGDSNS